MTDSAEPVPVSQLQCDTAASRRDHRLTQLFYAFCGLHLLIWTVVPTFSQPNAPLDTIEMLFWGHEWQWGYHKHPPLPAWLAELSTAWIGPYAWPTYLLAQLCTLACFGAVWSVMRRAAGAAAALICVMILEGSFYYNFTTPEFNNNVVSRACWALTIAFLYQGLIRQRLSGWILAGLMLGLGMLAKYDTAVLALTMLLFSIAHPLGRAAWKTPGPWLALVISLGCFAPHVWWLQQNDFPTLAYFQESSHSQGVWSDHFTRPGRFLLTQLGSVGLCLALLIPALGWKWRRQDRSGTALTRHDQAFLLAFGLGPLALILTFSLLTGATIKSMWGAPLFTFLGAVLLCLFRYRDDLLTVRRIGILSLGFSVICAGALIVHDVALPGMRHKLSRVHFPGRELAQQVDALCREHLGGAPHIAAGPWWTAANAAFYSQYHPSVYSYLSEQESPWMSDEIFRKEGGVVVWQEDEVLPGFLEDLQRRIPGFVELDPLQIAPAASGDFDPLTIHVGIVRPESALIQQAHVPDTARVN